jgi:hypothetical protein
MCGIFTIHVHVFSAAVLMFHKWVQRITRRQCGWQVWLPHSSAIMQITVSSVKPCLSLNGVDCICFLWNETLFPSSYVFYASENIYILLKIDSERFDAF